jgi:cytochrome c5
MTIDHAFATKLLGAAVALAWAVSAPASAADRSGNEVVDQVCAACHAAGTDGAPKIGDKKAWDKRAKRGLSSLTKTALEGVRKMPPHGGKLDLTDLEIKRAVAYMVNHSGGHWNEPIDRAHPPAQRSGKAIVEAQCVKCHGTGAGGAPKIGDKDAWVGRAKQGFDSAVRSAIAGHGGMPARGGMANLTDAEMRAAVTYMFQTSVKDWDKK